MRLTLGIGLGIHAARHLRRGLSDQSGLGVVLGLLEAILAILLTIGFLTQAAAILLLGWSVGTLALNYHHRGNFETSDLYFLIMAAAIVLATNGPGAWALDWPL